MTGCQQGVPPSLARELLCLDHFVEQTYTRARQALELCHQDQAMDRHTLDWVFVDAQFAVQTLMQDSGEQSATQRAKILELLLCLANIHEYLSHHSVHLPLPD